MKKKSIAKNKMGIEDLAVMVAKGFEKTVTKEDLKNYPTRDEMEMMMGRHIGVFRADYDGLTSRVKRLETVVFKR